MWPIIILLILIGAVLIGCSDRGRPRKADAPKPGPAPMAPVNVAALDRAEIAKRLESLAKSDAPRDLKPGAMCYEPAAPLNRADYVCPKCGAKTLHTDQLAPVVKDGIPHCRRLLPAIRGVSVELDESPFCKQCSPDVKTPRLGLVIRRKGEDASRRIDGVTPTDLQLLAEFLDGKTLHKTWNDGEEPLKNHLPRLKELLGPGPVVDGGAK